MDLCLRLSRAEEVGAKSRKVVVWLRPTINTSDRSDHEIKQTPWKICLRAGDGPVCSSLLMEGSSAADTSTEKRITKLFLTSGQVDLAREVVRLPLHRGRLSSGETVWFVLTDVSDFATSKKMGLTWAPSLSKAKDLASTRVAEMDESNNFTFKSGRVDFSPVQTLTAGRRQTSFRLGWREPGPSGMRTTARWFGWQTVMTLFSTLP